MADIKNVQDFLDAINPGSSLGYPTYYLCADGEVMSWEAVTEMKDRIIEAITAREKEDYANEDKQWDVVAYDIHWEGEPMICAHTNKPIESAYGVPDEDDEEEPEGHCMILAGDEHGIYAPKVFAKRWQYDLSPQGGYNPQEDIKILLHGSGGVLDEDNYEGESSSDRREAYWDAMATIERNCHLVFQGRVYEIEQNGDIWAYELDKRRPEGHDGE